MLTPPDGLSDADVTDALRRGWGVVAESLDYAPVGFGSHHWLAAGSDARWFVTVDDLEGRRRSASDPISAPRQRLSAAIATAYGLHQAGLEFVIAPIPTMTGDLLAPIDDRHVVSLYPHVIGDTHEWGRYRGREHLLAIVDRLIELHRTPVPAAAAPLGEDFSIPLREDLEAALTATTTVRPAGPYSVESERLLRRHVDSIISALNRYDRLVADVASRPQRYVVTHGEPHGANTITTPGGLVLVDWDTALLAPPERDLWMLLEQDAELGDRYTERTGTEVERTTIGLYRLAWDLTEIALYSDLFRRPHASSDDIEVSWEELNRYLDPSRWTEFM